MAWNGSGTFTRNYSWQNDRDNSIKVRADRMDDEFANYKAGLENCLTRDGQNSPSANIPFGGKKITGLAAGTATGDSVNFDQLSAANLATGSLRNVIRNSSFLIAQRGTTFASPASGTITLDGWRVFYDGTAGTFAISQDRTVAVVGASFNSAGLRWAQTVVGTSANAYIEQRIPNLRAFSNRTLIGYYQTAAALIIGGFQGKVEIGGNYGTGGAPSGAETYSNKTFGLVYATTYTSDRDFSLAVPSLTAKSFGTNGDDYFFIRIYVPPTTSTFDGYILTPTLSIVPPGQTFTTGPTAFPQMPYRSIREEREMCQEFYEKSYEDIVTAGTVSTPSQGAFTSRTADQLDRISVIFRTKKWKVPTCTVYSPSTGTASKIFDATGFADLAASTANPGQGGMLIFPTANTTAAHAYTYHWAADCEP